MIDFIAVDLAFENIEQRDFRFDLGPQAGVAGNRVADELHFVDPLLHAFVDQEHDPGIARLVPLDNRDLGLGKAVRDVPIFEFPPALGDHVGIERVANLESRLLSHGPFAHGIADKPEVLYRRSFDDTKDDDHAAGVR